MQHKVPALLLLVTAVAAAHAARALNGEPDPPHTALSMRAVVLQPEPPDVAAARAAAEVESVAAAVAATSWADQLVTGYLTNAQLASWSQDFVSRCGSIARRFSIGRSVQGADLWVVEIASNPGAVEAKPNFRYGANMHGDETSGRMLLPRLAEYLCANATADPRAARIIQGMHLFLIPTLNPDGYASKRRLNAAGVDLNRNYPSVFAVCSGTPPEACSPSLLQAASGYTPQPETTAVMTWSLSLPLTAAANLHEGAIVANYPWDGYNDMSMTRRGIPNPSPDDAAFIAMSRAYANNHASMYKSDSFAGGITNGAAWYPIYGSLQDWSYTARECFEITLELSNNKGPSARLLKTLWADNLNSLLALPIQAALGGVSGRVTSADGTVPLTGATVTVTGIAKAATAQGALAYYNKPLAAGTYTLTAQAPGYQAVTAAVTVPANAAGASRSFRLCAVGAAGCTSA